MQEKELIEVLKSIDRKLKFITLHIKSLKMKEMTKREIKNGKEKTN